MKIEPDMSPVIPYRNFCNPWQLWTPELLQDESLQDLCLMSNWKQAVKIGTITQTTMDSNTEHQSEVRPH